MGLDLACGFLIFFAFFLLGDKVHEKWRLSPSDGAEAFVFSTALGLVAVSCAVTLLALSGLIYPAAAWLLLATIFVARAARVRELCKALWSRIRSPQSSLPFYSTKSRLDTFNYGVLGILVILALALALAPPTATDALVYHLAVPKAYLQHHGMINLPDNIYSFFPLQFEMVYLFCLMLKGGALAQLAGLGMALLLLFALTLYYKRYLTPRYASLVPVLFFSTPTFWVIASTAYVDLAAAAFIFLAFYAWDRWRTVKQEGWFFLMIIFAAAAMATKLTALVALPLVFLGIVLRGREKGSLAWTLKKILLLVLAALFFLAPWWGRNLHYTGNPFVPFFMQIFGGENGINWDAHRSFLQFQYYQSFGMGHGIKEFLLLPINLSFFSEADSLRFDGRIGILYLLLLPGLFWLRPGNARGELDNAAPARRTRNLAVLFIILLVSWFMQSQYIRLLPASFVFLTLLSAYGYERMMRPTSAIGRRKILRTLVHAILAAGILFNLSLVGEKWKQPLPYLSGKENRDQYLTRHIASYPLFQTINNTLDREAKVLFVYMRNLGYLCDRDFISDTFFEAHTLKKLIDNDSSVEGMAGQIQNMGVTHLLFDNNYVFGKDTAFSPEQLEALKKFLNTRARLVEGKNGFYLYRLK